MAYLKDPQKKAAIRKAFAELPSLTKASVKAKSSGIQRLPPKQSDLLTHGKIGKGQGRPAGTRLFTVVGEFLWVDSIDELPAGMSGIYVLFDSSATARYVGLTGDIKKRLKQHMSGKSKADKQKQTFTERYSVYALSDGRHARELESILIRAIGSSLINDRKNRKLLDVKAKLGVYEPGTLVLESRW
jgi:predicted GIY-YIG superfamily endonuclease